MHTRHSLFTTASFNAIANDDFHTAQQPVRVAWEPYGRPEHGDPDPQSTYYRRIDGYVTPRSNHLHIECINGEEYIVAPGDMFAPSKQDWFGEEVVEAFDNPDDLPSTPFADQPVVIGKVDGNTCTAIGINTVLLLPNNLNSNRYGTCNVANTVSTVISELESFDEAGKEHAAEVVDSAFKKLRRARKGLNDEYTKTRVTGIPTQSVEQSDNEITFTHPK